MAKPYSFRYPTDILSTMEPWRNKLGEDFERVVSALADRDRAIEDHLSLDVAQGFLGFASGTQEDLVGTSFIDLNMEVTFTVPANRQLKMTYNVPIRNLDTTTDISEIRALDQDDNLLCFSSFEHAPFLDLDDINSSVRYSMTYFQQPDAGTHTWRLQARMAVDGNGEVTDAWGDSIYLAIEDIGPVGRLA